MGDFSYHQNHLENNMPQSRHSFTFPLAGDHLLTAVASAARLHALRCKRSSTHSRCFGRSEGSGFMVSTASDHPHTAVALVAERQRLPALCCKRSSTHNRCLGRSEGSGFMLPAASDHPLTVVASFAMRAVEGCPRVLGQVHSPPLQTAL